MPTSISRGEAREIIVRLYRDTPPDLIERFLDDHFFGRSDETLASIGVFVNETFYQYRRGHAGF